MTQIPEHYLFLPHSFSVAAVGRDTFSNSSVGVTEYHEAHRFWELYELHFVNQYIEVLKWKSNFGFTIDAFRTSRTPPLSPEIFALFWVRKQTLNPLFPLKNHDTQAK